MRRFTGAVGNHLGLVRQILAVVDFMLVVAANLLELTLQILGLADLILELAGRRLPLTPPVPGVMQPPAPQNRSGIQIPVSRVVHCPLDTAAARNGLDKGTRGQDDKNH